MNIRRLKEDGIRLFEAYLANLRSSPKLPPPIELLSDPSTSEALVDYDVSEPNFASRIEAGDWLQSMIETTGLHGVARDKGLWAWLSLRFFNTVCPADSNGHRKPGETARHIPDVTNFQRYYRHLLAGPWRIFRTHRDNPKRALAVLCQPLHKPGDIVEQLASRQELVTNRAFIKAATMLYVDPVTQQPQRGAGGKSKGAARRLADFCNQLDVTWDLYAMEADELLRKLPEEFKRFYTT